MLKKVLLPSIAVIVALGAVGIFGELNQEPKMEIIQREKITDFSYFPKPTLPSANVLERTLSSTQIQSTDYIKNLGNGYQLIHVVEDPYYIGEATLYYTNTKTSQEFTNTDSIQDLVKKGAIVFDYEVIENLDDRTNLKDSTFMTKNNNPVFTDSGLNGEYLTIAYVSENIRLSIYGNQNVDLQELIKSLDL